MNLKLSKRDRLILENIYLFDLSTKEIVKQLFFENQTMSAVDSALRRLGHRGKRLIRAVRAPGNGPWYYKLTQKGGKAIGVKLREQPYSINKVFQAFGRTYFINRPPTNLVRSLHGLDELIQLLNIEAEKNSRVARVDFFIQQNTIVDREDKDVRLGMLIPDLNSSVRRVVDRCVKTSRNMIQRQRFLEPMRAGRFELVLLTGQQLKCDELEFALGKIHTRLKREYWENDLSGGITQPIACRVEYIPELADLSYTKRKTNVGKCD